MSLLGYRQLLSEQGEPALTLIAGRATKGGVVGRAQEVATREQAEALRGLTLHVPRDSLPEPDEDEFYLADLIGMTVETAAGEVLGRVRAVQDFGAGDLLEIAPAQGAAWYLPFTKAAVPEVRLGEGRLIAVPPETIE